MAGSLRTASFRSSRAAAHARRADGCRTAAERGAGEDQDLELLHRRQILRRQLSNDTQAIRHLALLGRVGVTAKRPEAGVPQDALTIIRQEWLSRRSPSRAITRRALVAVVIAVLDPLLEMPEREEESPQIRTIAIDWHYSQLRGQEVSLKRAPVL